MFTLRGILKWLKSTGCPDCLRQGILIRVGALQTTPNWGELFFLLPARLMNYVTAPCFLTKLDAGDENSD